MPILKSRILECGNKLHSLGLQFKDIVHDNKCQCIPEIHWKHESTKEYNNDDELKNFSENDGDEEDDVTISDCSDSDNELAD